MGKIRPSISSPAGGCRRSGITARTRTDRFPGDIRRLLLDWACRCLCGTDDPATRTLRTGATHTDGDGGTDRVCGCVSANPVTPPCCLMNGHGHCPVPRRQSSVIRNANARGNGSSGTCLAARTLQRGIPTPPTPAPGPRDRRPVRVLNSTCLSADVVFHPVGRSRRDRRPPNNERLPPNAEHRRSRVASQTQPPSLSRETAKLAKRSSRMEGGPQEAPARIPDHSCVVENSGHRLDSFRPECYILKKSRLMPLI